MMRLWERAFRRADLPIRMSQGYNPRPKMSLPEPRSVGIASEAEILEFELADWVNPDALIERLRDQVPPGIVPDRLEMIRPSEKARPEAVTYTACLADPPSDLPARIEKLLARTEAPVVRHRPGKDKHLDARPFIESLQARDREVAMVLRTGPSGTTRPDEVLRLLDLDDEAAGRADVRRTEIRLG